MALPEERKFATFRRGKVRDDIILARFRTNLRDQINPDTDQPFTEDEITVITQEDSRFYIEADAIDLYGQAIQQRSIWFADQVRPERAASGWLRNFHGALWLPEGLLAATGGSGPVEATGGPGIIFAGSTTLGDPTARIARDPSGKRYQVLVTTEDVNNDGTVELQMQAIDPGDSTNILSGTVLTWINPPLGADPEASTTGDFSGGFNEETENEYARRITRRIANKPGAGNSAQFRIWAQQSTTAVQDAFIYPAVLHTGSVMAAVVQKRGTATGPDARVPSIGTLTTVTAYLTPPTSPVVPHGVHVLVVPINPEPVDMAMRLAMPRGSSGGWTDVDPWPKFSPAFPEGVKIFTAIPNQIIINTDIPVPGMTSVGDTVSGADAPAMAVWDEDQSKFHTLDVASVVWTGATQFNIFLNSPVPTSIADTNDRVSPKNERAPVIEESFTDYYDELGPSELVQSDDVRYSRAARHPRPDQEYPTRAGQGIIARLDDTLGGALADAELEFISQNEPTVPSEFQIQTGPNILTLGDVGIYSFD